MTPTAGMTPGSPLLEELGHRFTDTKIMRATVVGANLTVDGKQGGG